MNRRLFGALGVVAVLTLSVGSCKNDPLSDLDNGTPAALVTDFSYLEVIIADTLTVTATVVDGRATPVVANITFRTCNAVAATAIDPSYHPVPATSTRAIVTGVTYGTSCLIVEGGGFTDTVQIATFPAGIVITGPDAIGSGETAVFGYEYRDAAGAPVTGVPLPTFSSGDTLRAKVFPSPLGSVTARAPGLVTLTVTGTGSPAGGVTGTKSVTVVPGTFTGTVTPGSGAPADVIKFTRAAGGPAFDADTRLAFGPGFTNASWTDSIRVTADSIKGAVPIVASTGTIPFVLTNIGPAQIALAGTFTISATDLADPYDATNDNPATAPIIAADGASFIILSGACASGVGGAGTDCDDFFRVTNPSATDSMSAVVRFGWVPAGADVDILWCKNATCSGAGNVITGGGATLANPETSTLTTTTRIPPGATWYLWLNTWEALGVASMLGRVTIVSPQLP